MAIKMSNALFIDKYVLDIIIWGAKKWVLSAEDNLPHVL